MEGLVDKATSEGLLMPDWGANMEISDRAGSSTEMALDTARAIKRRLGHKNPKVVHLALTLLDTCVKNSGPRLHAAAGSKEVGIAPALAALVEGKAPAVTADGEVVGAAAALLQELAIAFAPQASSLQFKPAYDALVDKGVRFPPVDPGQVTVYPVPAVTAAAASPSLQAARAAALSTNHHPGHGMASSAFGLPPGMTGAALAATASGGRQGQQQAVAQPVPHRPQQHQQHAGYGPGPYPGQQQPYPQPHHPQQGSGGAGLARLPLEQQLAAVDQAFDKLRRDLAAVRERVAEAAKLGVAGHTGPTCEPWLDAVEFAAQCVSRLQALVEVGVSGVLDEALFEETLAVYEGATRIAAAGEEDLKAAEAGLTTLVPTAHVANPEAPEASGLAGTASGGGAGRARPELADLVNFNQPQGAAAGRPAAGGVAQGEAGAAAGTAVGATASAGGGAGADLLGLFSAPAPAPAPAPASAGVTALGMGMVAGTGVASAGLDAFDAPGTGTRAGGAATSGSGSLLAAFEPTPVGGGLASGAAAGQPAGSPTKPSSAIGLDDFAPSPPPAAAGVEGTVSAAPPLPGPAAAASPAGGAVAAGSSDALQDEIDDLLRA